MRKTFFIVAVLSPAIAGQLSFGQLLVDRGLTSVGVNRTVWTERSNISWATYDPKDPIFVGIQPPDVSADDFTLPTAEATYRVTNIRIFLKGYGQTAFSDMFNGVSLMLGTSISTPLTTLSVVPTVMQIHYPGGENYGTPPGSDLYALDYGVDFTAAGGTKYYVGILPDGKAIPGGTGSNGETYYICWPLDTRRDVLTGYNPGADGILHMFYANGTYEGFLNFNDNSYWGQWAPYGGCDMNIQVSGVAVPEPGSVLLCTCAAGFLCLRRGPTRSNAA